MVVQSCSGSVISLSISKTSSTIWTRLNKKGKNNQSLTLWQMESESFCQVSSSSEMSLSRWSVIVLKYSAQSTDRITFPDCATSYMLTRSICSNTHEQPPTAALSSMWSHLNALLVRIQIAPTSGRVNSTKRSTSWRAKSKNNGQAPCTWSGKILTVRSVSFFGHSPSICSSQLWETASASHRLSSSL